MQHCITTRKSVTYAVLLAGDSRLAKKRQPAAGYDRRPGIPRPYLLRSKFNFSNRASSSSSGKSAGQP